jgi:hypothetical protein
MGEGRVCAKQNTRENYSKALFGRINHACPAVPSPRPINRPVSETYCGDDVRTAHSSAGTSTCPEATLYVAAEAEVEKAIDILKIALARPHDEYEDLGRVTDTLLNALDLQPGQFART